MISDPEKNYWLGMLGAFNYIHACMEKGYPRENLVVAVTDYISYLEKKLFNEE